MMGEKGSKQSADHMNVGKFGTDTNLNKNKQHMSTVPVTSGVGSRPQTTKND